MHLSFHDLSVVHSTHTMIVCTYFCSHQSPRRGGTHNEHHHYSTIQVHAVEVEVSMYIRPYVCTVDYMYIGKTKINMMSSGEWTVTQDTSRKGTHVGAVWSSTHRTYALCFVLLLLYSPFRARWEMWEAPAGKLYTYMYLKVERNLSKVTVGYVHIYVSYISNAS